MRYTLNCLNVLPSRVTNDCCVVQGEWCSDSKLQLLRIGIHCYALKVLSVLRVLKRYLVPQFFRTGFNNILVKDFILKDVTICYYFVLKPAAVFMDLYSSGLRFPNDHSFCCFFKTGFLLQHRLSQLIICPRPAIFLFQLSSLATLFYTV